MDCNEARERIQDALDDRLPAEERRRVEDHLASCEACDTERAEIARTMALLSALPREPAPEVLAAEVMSRLGSRPAPRGRRLTLPIALLGACAAAAILLLAVLSLVPTQGPGPREETTVAREEDDKSPRSRDALATEADGLLPAAPVEEADAPFEAAPEDLARAAVAKKIGPESERLALGSVLELRVKDPVAVESRVCTILATLETDRRQGGEEMRGKARDGEARGSRRAFGGAPGSPAPAEAPRPAKPRAESEADDASDRDPGSGLKEAGERKDEDARKGSVESAKTLSRDLTLSPDQVKALLAHLLREQRLRVSARRGAPAPVADPAGGDAGDTGGGAGAGSAGSPADAGAGAGRGAVQAPAGATLDRLRVAIGDDQALLDALRGAAGKTGNTVLRLVGPATARADRAATGR